MDYERGLDDLDKALEGVVRVRMGWWGGGVEALTEFSG